MAGQLKEVRSRISSVQSTQQITKAMKMVSAAKLRRAQEAILQMRPYAQKLQEMLSNIVKLAKQVIAKKYQTQFSKGNVTIWNIGKKGFESLTRTGYKTVDTYKD